MDKIRCKFQRQSVKKVVNGWRSLTPGTIDPPFTYEVSMTPVSGGQGATEENKKFWRWTPSGSIQFTSINCDQFEPGKSYYIDITEAE